MAAPERSSEGDGRGRGHFTNCTTWFIRAFPKGTSKSNPRKLVRCLEAIIWQPHRRIARAHQDSLMFCAAALALPGALLIGADRIEFVLRLSELFG